MPDANLARQVADRATERAQEVAKSMAERIGQPVDVQQMSRAEVQKLWWMINPQSTPDQVNALIAAGKHSEAVDLAYPWRNKLIGRGAPTDRVQRAQQIAKLAEPEQPPQQGTLL